MTKIFSFSSSQQSLTDQELFEGLLVNSRSVTEYLYKKCYPLVAAQLSRMGAGEEDVQDMFQEGLITLWKNAKQGKYQVQAEAKLSSYLVQVCKWQWSDHRKKTANKREIHMNVQQDQPADSSFLEEWFAEEEREQFYHVFQELGLRCQDILKRFYFDRTSMKQIAYEFSITEATAKNEKYRCMQRLKKLFQAQSS